MFDAESLEDDVLDGVAGSGSPVGGPAFRSVAAIHLTSLCSFLDAKKYHTKTITINSVVH